MKIKNDGMPLDKYIWANRISVLLQQEYDRHYDNYSRGCYSCLVGAMAVRDVAKKLGMPINEKHISRPNPVPVHGKH